MAEQWRSFSCPLCHGFLLVGEHSIKPDRERADRRRAKKIEEAAKELVDSFDDYGPSRNEWVENLHKLRKLLSE